MWRPYTQMKHARARPAVARTEGVRLHLTDGRVLVDGVASWWTACHGYNHPHIVEAMRRQVELMPHVMLGGLAHEQAYVLARRLAQHDMGHALACAAANASLDLFETGEWQASGARIQQGLKAGLAPCRGRRGVCDVRVRGAIGVVELDSAPDYGELIARFIDLGVWIKPFGRISI